MHGWPRRHSNACLEEPKALCGRKIRLSLQQRTCGIVNRFLQNSCVQLAGAADSTDAPSVGETAAGEAICQALWDCTIQ